MKFLHGSIQLWMITLVALSAVIPEISAAENLTWVTTRQEAFDIAQQQGKKVMLLAGRDT